MDGLSVVFLSSILTGGCVVLSKSISFFFTFFPRLLAWHKSDIFYPPPPHTYSFAGIMPDRVGGAPNGVVCPLSISILLRVLCACLGAPSSFPKKIIKFKKYIYL